MSEREEIGSSTILGIACGRIQCLTLRAWCVARWENESAWVEKCGYMFDKSIPSLEEEKGDSHGGQAAQLSEAKQSSRGLAESRSPPVLTPAWGLASITWLAGHHCSEPLKLMTSSPPLAGPASAFRLTGSDTSRGSKACSALLNRKSAPTGSQKPRQ